jgi:hypothetical protein
VIRYEMMFVGVARAVPVDVIARQEFPPGSWPVPGDLIRDARIGDFTFVVVRRQFAWDAEGDCTYTVAVDLVESPGQPGACDAGNVVPFARPGAGQD